MDALKTYERWQQMLYRDWIDAGGSTEAFVAAFVGSIGVVVRMCIRDEFVKRAPYEKHEAIYIDLAKRYGYSVIYIRKICEGMR